MTIAPDSRTATPLPAGPVRIAPVAPLPVPRRRLSIVVDPRFSGGTAAAVAAEVRTLAPLTDLRVVALETAMFKGTAVNPALARAIEETGTPLEWNPPVVRADTVVFHNPSCLRFDTALPVRIGCRTALVVTHENFLRPGGAEGFDVAGCLALIERALVCGRRRLAPVSAHNRRSVAAWVAARDADWELAEFDWFNICDMALAEPTASPRDRRGRHSRAGLEKFPPRETMLQHFPPHAERCAILGADGLMLDPDGVPAHWRVRPFGSVEVSSFLAELDFFVYFTHPRWRESFGRAIAEAIAAGKLVITDPGTAESFGDGVIASTGDDVDATVSEFVADPERYRAFVRRAQAQLARFSPAAFAGSVLPALAALEADPDGGA